MVCVPCIVIPVLLWFFHKYIQPIILKFWNPWEKKSVASPPGGSADQPCVDSEMEKSKEYLYIQKMITDHPVMVFSKMTCSYCNMAKEVLDGTGVNYTIEEIDQRPDGDKLQDIFAKLTGARTVPRVFIKGKCIGGGTDTYSLQNQNKLIPMMREAGATFKKTN